jgi:hypothetical protein
MLSYMFSFLVALPPCLNLLMRHKYVPHRKHVVLVSRLGALACAVVPHMAPERAYVTCSGGSLWRWLLNSHALTSGFVALGFPLPPLRCLSAAATV